MGLPANRKTKQETKQDDALKLAMLNMKKLKNPSNITPSNIIYGLAGRPIVDTGFLKRYKIVSNYDADDDNDAIYELGLS